MEKKKMSRMMQLLRIICFIAVVALTVMFTGGTEAKASWKSQSCSLQSITVEIEGTQYTFESGLEPTVPVSDKEWAEILSTIKIVDYTIVTDDICTCENHDLSFELYGEYDYFILQDFLTYKDGVCTNALQGDTEVDLGSYGYYDFYLWNRLGWMDIFLGKEYSIQYELDGGSFPEGMEVPATYNSADGTKIPAPERDGYIFTGWTSNEEEEPVVDGYVYSGFSGNVTFTAHWQEGERTDISAYSVEYTESWSYKGSEREPSVTVIDSSENELKHGTDYIVSYKNNINVADADSDNPPTIIVTGIGKYKGKIECTFSITKAELYLYGGYANVIRGEALSSADLSKVMVRSWVSDAVVPGTWAWTDPDTIVDAEIGEVDVCYEATFTPTDTSCYESLTDNVCVRIKASAEDWEISFAEEEILSYTGEAHTPSVVVVIGETTLEEGTDYSVSYVNNVNAGDESDEDAPTVIIKGIGDYVGTRELTFTIDKATATIETAPAAGAIEEGKKLSDSALTGGKVVDAKGNALEGVFGWKDGSIMPALTDSGVTKYTVVFTPKDTNYKTAETTVVVMVNEKKETSEPKPETKPEIKVGDQMLDKNSEATYRITKISDGKTEVTYVAPKVDQKKVTIPDTVTLADGTVADVTAIADGAFKKNTKLQEVTIGKNVKIIGKEAFSGCKNLKKVKGAKSVTSIGNSAFANCSKLTSVAMSSKLTSIGEKAFYKCSRLTKITIPKNVNYIGKSAFQGCKKLKNIKIKTTKLTKKNVKKKAFKGISGSAKIDVPNKKVKAYKSILRSRGVSKTATIN